MEWRRQQRKTKKEAVASWEEPSYAGIHDVPDDLLRLILLRLDSPIWLLRAACACKQWRQIITDGADNGRAFLRLASSLHAPAVMGQYYRRNFDMAQGFVPSSPPPPIVDSRFSFDFLPSTLKYLNMSNWKFVECHGGLVLLRYEDTSDLVVCDPLARQYQGICCPPVPEQDQQAARRADDCSFPDVFLLDGNDGHISVSNFRVLFWSDDHVIKRSRAYVFNTTDGGGVWPLLRESVSDYSYRYDNSGVVAGRVDGSPYLSMVTGSVIALDSATLEFSKVDLPIRVKKSSLSSIWKQHSTFAIVHGSASPDFASPRTTACIIHVLGNELELFRRVHGSSEWMLEHSIPSLRVASSGLPGYSNYGSWMAVDVTAGDTGLAVLKVYYCSIRRWCFAMDINTMELQVLPDKVAHRREFYTWETFNYTLPWPQFLRACA